MKPAGRYKANRRLQSGLSLLEVLIAVAVLSIGLLGVAHLQATGLLSNQRAMQRSQATLLAYDVADRMRANPTAISSYLSSNKKASEARAQSTCKTTSGCSTALMAENDLYEWNSALTAALPSAVGTVTTSGSTYTVSITWDDDASGTVTSDDPTFNVTFQP